MDPASLPLRGGGGERSYAHKCWKYVQLIFLFHTILNYDNVLHIAIRQNHMKKENDVKFKISCTCEWDLNIERIHNRGDTLAVPSDVSRGANSGSRNSLEGARHRLASVGSAGFEVWEFQTSKVRGRGLGCDPAQNFAGGRTPHAWPFRRASASTVRTSTLQRSQKSPSQKSRSQNHDRKDRNHAHKSPNHDDTRKTIKTTTKRGKSKPQNSIKDQNKIAKIKMTM